MTWVPFTYLIIFTNPTTCEKKYYYGVRYATDCNPSQLFTTYFTSSTKVQSLLKEYGKECFETEVRRTFPENRDKAMKWEQTVLRRLKAPQRHDFLNQCVPNQMPVFLGADNPSKREDVRTKISKSKLGKKHSEETKAKLRGPRPPSTCEAISKGCMGRKYSDEEKLKMSVTRTGKRTGPRPHISIKMKGVKTPHLFISLGQCSYCGSNVTHNNKHWHGDNCKLVRTTS